MFMKKKKNTKKQILKWFPTWFSGIVSERIPGEGFNKPQEKLTMQPEEEHLKIFWEISREDLQKDNSLEFSGRIPDEKQRNINFWRNR